MTIVVNGDNSAIEEDWDGSQVGNRQSLFGPDWESVKPSPPIACQHQEGIELYERFEAMFPLPVESQGGVGWME